MGAGIAEIVARAGRSVVVLEHDTDAAARGFSTIQSSLSVAVNRRKLARDDAEAALANVSTTADPGDLADCQLVVEAVVEDESRKSEVFALLDHVVTDTDAVLATNTSSIPIMKLAMATGRPERVIGMHFFNPVPVLDLVEVVPSLVTAPDTIDIVTGFAGDVLGKRVVRSPDRAGFVVNALLIPYLLSAIRMLESGFATAADIDDAMVHGCVHPMGPLALADLIGLDTTLAVAVSLYEEFKEPLYAPPPLLSRMVDAGLLGRKNGRGFFDHR
jgi:3-hydroxybutyryl-CoA dehydrogenase